MPFDPNGGYTTTEESAFLSKIKSQILSIWGNANTDDLTDLGILSNIAAYLLTLDEQTFLEFFNQTFIGTSTGDTLDKRLEDFYFKRRQPTHSLVTLSFQGKPGNTISKGFLASSTTGVTFETIGDIEITSTDWVKVSAQSQGTGSECNVPENTITNLESSISYVYKVKNESASVGGLDLETDEELRTRFYSNSGQLSLNQIIQGIQSLNGVGRVFITENYTDAEDVINQIPSHSVEIVADGGDELVIAQFLLDSAPFGCQFVGDNTVSVKDVSGQLRQVGFSRPTSLDVFVTIDLKVQDTSFDKNSFLSTYQAILENYINSFLGDKLVDWQMLSLFSSTLNIDNIDLYFSTDSQTKGEVYMNRPVKSLFSTSVDKIKLGNVQVNRTGKK